MRYIFLSIALFMGLNTICAQDSLVTVSDITASLPKGWTGYEQNNKIIFISGPENEEDAFTENININKKQSTRNYTTADFKELGEMLEAQIRPSFETLSNYKYVVSKNTLTITYNGKLPQIVDGELYFKQRFITKNKIQYTITLTAEASNIKNIAIADKVMESITIK